MENNPCNRYSDIMKFQSWTSKVQKKQNPLTSFSSTMIFSPDGSLRVGQQETGLSIPSSSSATGGCSSRMKCGTHRSSRISSFSSGEYSVHLLPRYFIKDFSCKAIFLEIWVKEEKYDRACSSSISLVEWLRMCRKRKVQFPGQVWSEF